MAESKRPYKPQKAREEELVKVKRYEIRWATLDLIIGSEMAKQRPVVIVSRDELNARLDTVTVCPQTSQLHPTWRTRFRYALRGGIPRLVDHIRSISKERLGKRLGALAATEAAALRRLIVEMFGTA